MCPQPLYPPEKLTAAYHLRYSWTGWPSSEKFPDAPPAGLLDQIRPLWETDGLRLLEHNWTADRIQLTLSTKPHVSPVVLAGRAKGRLQYALRNAGLPSDFSRKFSVRSIGKNRRDDVERYIANQVKSASFVDREFREWLETLTMANPSVDLSQPTESSHGRYWYNLHLVLVAEHVSRVVDRPLLVLVRDRSVKIAEKKGYGISRLSPMPDHLHISLRGRPADSPEAIALAFLNNLAYALGQKPVWRSGYYAGTFGEYDMVAVRR